MESSLVWHIKTFDALNKRELHDILQLRSEVFVVEQDCVYQDIDGKDQMALHVFCVSGEKIRAYARLFKRGDYFEEASIGRVVVSKEARKGGVGHQLIQKSIKAVAERFGTATIKISAQTYLINFYKQHGFREVGEEYLEDGIPHVAMIKE